MGLSPASLAAAFREHVGPDSQRVVLPYPPSVNHYWRHVGNKVLISREGRAYRTAAAVRALQFGIRCCRGPVKLEIDVYRPRRIGDLDNCAKAVLDSLRGFAYVDDAQVVEIHARRFDDKADPRAVVTIHPVPEE